MEENKNKNIIKNLKTEIAAKEQQIKDLKSKIEMQKKKYGIAQSAIFPSHKPLLSKIVGEIGEIKQIVSGRFDDLEDLVPMESVYSGGENFNALNKLKAEVEKEKKEVKAEQEEVEEKKEKWQNDVASIRLNNAVDPKENKRSLIIEKSEIDSQIKSINAKIKGIKAKTMKIQKMEAELQSSISKRALDKLSDLGDDNEGNLLQ